MHFILRFYAHSYSDSLFECVSVCSFHFIIRMCIHWFPKHFVFIFIFLAFFRSVLVDLVFFFLRWLNVDPKSSEVSDWREILYFYIKTQHIYMLKTISHNWIDKTFRFHLFFVHFFFPLGTFSFNSVASDASLFPKSIHFISLLLLRLAILKRTKFIPFGCATRNNIKLLCWCVSLWGSM